MPCCVEIGDFPGKMSGPEPFMAWANHRLCQARQRMKSGVAVLFAKVLALLLYLAWSCEFVGRAQSRAHGG